jgi:hypothetical protein|nr:MAG TPA: hypothetical protein [Caudoviricetes sp.]
MKKTIYTSTQNAYTETGYFIITDVFKNTIMIPSFYVREWESMHGELTNKRHKEIIVDYFGIPHGFTVVDRNQ